MRAGFPGSRGQRWYEINKTPAQVTCNCHIEPSSYTCTKQSTRRCQVEPALAPWAPAHLFYATDLGCQRTFCRRSGADGTAIRPRYRFRNSKNCLFPPGIPTGATSGVFDNSSSFDAASAARCHAIRVIIRLDASASISIGAPASIFHIAACPQPAPGKRGFKTMLCRNIKQVMIKQTSPERFVSRLFLGTFGRFLDRHVSIPPHRSAISGASRPDFRRSTSV